MSKTALGCYLLHLLNSILWCVFLVLIIQRATRLALRCFIPWYCYTDNSNKSFDLRMLIVLWEKTSVKQSHVFWCFFWISTKLRKQSLALCFISFSFLWFLLFCSHILTLSVLSTIVLSDFVQKVCWFFKLLKNGLSCQVQLRRIKLFYLFLIF